MEFGPKAVLVACADESLRFYIAELLRSHLPRDPAAPAAGANGVAIHQAHDVESARPFGQTVDLAVVQANLHRRGAAPRGSLVVPFGWHLVQEWQRTRPDLPVVVILEEDGLLNAVQASGNAWPMRLDLDGDMETTLGQILAKMARRGSAAHPADSAAPPGVGDENATIEVDLRFEVSPTYRVKIVKDRKETIRSPRGPQDFQVDWRKLMMLQDLSENLPKVDKWHATFKNIGEQLYDALAQGKFPIHLAEARGACGGQMDKIRIRFTIGTDVYGVPFEAMYDGDMDSHLVLTSPLARRVAMSSGIETLAAPLRAPLNILVIEADVGPEDYVRSGTADDPIWDNFISEKGKFARLHNVPEECESLRTLKSRLAARRRAHLIGNVVVLAKRDLERFDGTFSQLLQHTLAPQPSANVVPVTPRFDIVHFAGHSVFVKGYPANRTPGFLILPGRDDAERLDMETFAEWLQRAEVRLAYLSSCNSSEADAAFALARCNVPAVIGFRWDLDDRLAASYAIKFYEKLFLEALCVDKAFLAARCCMHKEYANDRIWAAPILLIQNDDWDTASSLDAVSPPQESRTNA